MSESEARGEVKDPQEICIVDRFLTVAHPLELSIPFPPPCSPPDPTLSFQEPVYTRVKMQDGSWQLCVCGWAGSVFRCFLRGREGEG